MTDEVLVQIDIEFLRHALLLLCRSGRNQRQLDSQRLQNCECFPDLAGLLAFLQIDDKPQSRSRRQREILLGDPQILTRLPNLSSNLLWCVAHESSGPQLPYGNITAILACEQLEHSRTGMFQYREHSRPEDIPVRECLSVSIGWACDPIFKGEDDTVRLIVISDTHGLHNRIEGLPDGDVLVHAGDFMNSGYDVQEVLSFNQWLSEQPFKHRVVCGGNHDRYFEAAPQQARALLTNAIYLENTGITIDDVTFWGSPYTPEFMNWAFMYPRGTSAQRYWNLIPDNLDVLITHGPPFGILDQTAPAKHISDATNCSMPSWRRNPGYIYLVTFTVGLERSRTEPRVS